MIYIVLSILLGLLISFKRVVTLSGYYSTGYMKVGLLPLYINTTQIAKKLQALNVGIGFDGDTALNDMSNFFSNLILMNI